MGIFPNKLFSRGENDGGAWTERVHHEHGLNSHKLNDFG